MESDERTLLAEYRQGNTDALGKLVDHYRRPLSGFILKMTEGREDAEEIFQETWFRAIRALDSYREKRFLSWLFRIAHNLVIDRSRRVKPLPIAAGSAGEDDHPPEERIPDPAMKPDAIASGRDLGARIAAAVAALPSEQREVFVMRMEGDVPFKDIAKIQGVSINTALARMQYALGKLRERLGGEYETITGVKP